MTDVDLIYYQNIHYNDTNAPLDSNYNAILNNTFISNQSNYLVSVNKFKISDLSTIPISKSNIPFRTYELGLQIGNNIVSKYVDQPNLSLTNNLYNYNSVTNKIDIYTYTAIPNSINYFGSVSVPAQITQINQVVTDSQNNFWISTPSNLYVVSPTGSLIASLVFGQIVYVSISYTSQCIVCDSNTNSVSVCVLNNNQIQITNVINQDKNGSPLNNLVSASFDNQNLIVVHDTNSFSFYNSNFNPTSIGSNSNIINAVGSAISTQSNRFFVVDSSVAFSAPTILCTVQQPGTTLQSGQINVYNLNTNTLIYEGIDGTQTYFAGNNILTFSGINNGTPTRYIFTPLNQLEPNSDWSEFTQTAGIPDSISISALNAADMLGISYAGLFYIWNGPASLWMPTTSQLPTTGIISQVAFDPIGYVWVCTNTASGYKIYKSDSVYNTLTGNNTISFTNPSITSNIDVISISFDLHQPTICYGVTDSVTGTGILYKGVYDSKTNSINFQSYKSDQHYCNFILITPYDDNSTTTVSNYLRTFKLDSLQLVLSEQLVSTPISNQCSVDQTNNLLFLADISNNKALEFDLETGTLNGDYFTIANISNVYVKQADDTDQGTLDIFDLNTYITQFNVCFQNCYNRLKLLNPAITITTAPSFTLDYTTGKLTLNYDTAYSTSGNGILINDSLLFYAKFPVGTQISGLNSIVLNSSGALTQPSSTIWKLNQLDKIVLQTSLMLVSDITGVNSKSLNIFTEFDIDTSNPTFFNNDCSLLYSAILLRNYVLNSNTELRNIQYSFYYQYKNGERYKYMIPVGENLSIKLQFSRVFKINCHFNLI